MLYPLKFVPIFKEKVWGGKRLQTFLNKNISSSKTGESWEISTVKNNISIVANGAYAGISIQKLIERNKSDFLGKKVYDNFGLVFPLLIKFIDACDDLSVQVHPDDHFAQLKHNENGKNEMWFVVEADPDSELILGVNKTLIKSEYLKIVKEKKLKEILHSEKVKAGDALYIPAGRIHAIMKGVLLAEIQQNSDLTYRIYDWDRKDLNGNLRELHNELAAEVVELQKKDDYFINYKNRKNGQLVSNQYFTVNHQILSGSVFRNYSDRESFVVLMCISGRFIVNYNKTTLTIEKGETVLIPAILTDLELVFETNTEILEIYL